MNNKSIIGQRFGKLTVISRAQSRVGHKSSYWLCICDCGGIKEIAKSNLKTNGRGINSCGCLLKLPTGPNNKLWVGVGEIPNTLFCKIKRHAKRRKIYFDLTIEYLWDLFVQQQRQCVLSGLLLTFPNSCKDRYNNNYTASLDRIDSKEGYTINNVQWVHKDINMMKQSLSQSQFVEYCKLVTRRMS